MSGGTRAGHDFELALASEEFPAARQTTRREDPPRSPALKDPNPKDAAGSARIDYALMDPVACGEMCLAMEEGGTKYGYFNYTISPVKSRVYVGAAFRHLFKWLMGEERDEKTGVHHLGSVMACCMIILSAQSRGILVDNRPPSLKGASSRVDDFEARVRKVRDVFRMFSPRHYSIGDTDGTGEQDDRRSAQAPQGEGVQREDAQHVPGRDRRRVVQPEGPKRPVDRVQVDRAGIPDWAGSS